MACSIDRAAADAGSHPSVTVQKWLSKNVPTICKVGVLASVSLLLTGCDCVGRVRSYTRVPYNSCYDERNQVERIQNGRFNVPENTSCTVTRDCPAGWQPVENTFKCIPSLVRTIGKFLMFKEYEEIPGYPTIATAYDGCRKDACATTPPVLLGGATCDPVSSGGVQCAPRCPDMSGPDLLVNGRPFDGSRNLVLCDAATTVACHCTGDLMRDDESRRVIFVRWSNFHVECEPGYQFDVRPGHPAFARGTCGVHKPGTCRRANRALAEGDVADAAPVTHEAVEVVGGAVAVQETPVDVVQNFRTPSV